LDKLVPEIYIFGMIREIEIEDYKIFNKLFHQICNESEYMLFAPNEANISDEAQLNRIKSIKKSSNSKIFIAEIDNELIGFLILRGDEFRRRAHIRYIAMGVLREYCSKGLGPKLLKAAIEDCEKMNIKRMELVVDVLNVRGIKLYQRMGFEIEGIFRKAKLIDGVFTDQYSMSKIFN
jgi:RimJ/RimL family protein N-acetyltransferase